MSNTTVIFDRFARTSFVPIWPRVMDRVGMHCLIRHHQLDLPYRDLPDRYYYERLPCHTRCACYRCGTHLWLISHHDEVNLRQYVSYTVTELETSDLVVNQYLAEVEAPLFLNTEFMLMAPCLAAMAAMRQHPRRLALCLFIQLLVFLAQFPIFLWSIDGGHWVMDLERLPLLLVGTRSM